MLSFAGTGFTPLRTEAPLLSWPLLDPDKLLSDSGGGVGGNTFRLRGGSDCCLLLDKPGLTRLAAANERFSAGRSSFASDVFPACFGVSTIRIWLSVSLTFFISEPANPVNAFALSEAATNLAFPK